MIFHVRHFLCIITQQKSLNLIYHIVMEWFLTLISECSHLKHTHAKSESFDKYMVESLFLVVALFVIYLSLTRCVWMCVCCWIHSCKYFITRKKKWECARLCDGVSCVCDETVEFCAFQTTINVHLVSKSIDTVILSDYCSPHTILTFQSKFQSLPLNFSPACLSNSPSPTVHQTILLISIL